MQMQESLIEDARKQRIVLNFQFEMRANKLIIKAEARDATYQAEVAENPDVDFNNISERLLTKQYNLRRIRSDVLRLTVAELDIEFINTDKLLINQLRERIAEQQRLHLITQTELNTRGELLALKDRDILTITARLNESIEREQLARRECERLTALNNQQNLRIQQLTEENARLNRLGQQIRRVEEERERMYLAGRREIERIGGASNLKDRQILFHKQKVEEFKDKIDKLEDKLYLQQQFSTRQIESKSNQIAELKSFIAEMERHTRNQKYSRSKSKGNKKKHANNVEDSCFTFSKDLSTEPDLAEPKYSNTLPVRQLKNPNQSLSAKQPPKIVKKMSKKEEQGPNPQIEKKDSSKERKRQFSNERKQAHSKDSQKQYTGICSRNCELKHQRESSKQHSKSRSQKNSKSKSKGHKRDTSKDSIGKSQNHLGQKSLASKLQDIKNEMKRLNGQDISTKPSYTDQYARRMNVNQIANQVQKPINLGLRKVESEQAPAPTHKLGKERSFIEERNGSKSPISKNASFNPPRPGSRFSNNYVNEKVPQNYIKRY